MVINKNSTLLRCELDFEFIPKEHFNDNMKIEISLHWAIFDALMLYRNIQKSDDYTWCKSCLEYEIIRDHQRDF